MISFAQLILQTSSYSRALVSEISIYSMWYKTVLFSHGPCRNLVFLLKSTAGGIRSRNIWSSSGEQKLVQMTILGIDYFSFQLSKKLIHHQNWKWFQNRFSHARHVLYLNLSQQFFRCLHFGQLVLVRVLMVAANFRIPQTDQNLSKLSEQSNRIKGMQNSLLFLLVFFQRHPVLETSFASEQVSHILLLANNKIWLTCSEEKFVSKTGRRWKNTKRKRRLFCIPLILFDCSNNFALKWF